MSERVKIADLKPGMVIVRIIEQNGPVKIRKSGLVSSAAMVTGLAEMGVQEVEVDPAQTVEIDGPVHHRTQTQKLLRGEHDTSVNKLDSAISDQFNRSLFLPTVQGLPSMWKIYTRQVASFAVVVIAGLAIGGAAGSYPAWWQKDNATVLVSPAEQTEADGTATQSGGGEDSDVAEETQAALSSLASNETQDAADGTKSAAEDSTPVRGQNDATSQTAPQADVVRTAPEPPLAQETVEEELGGEIINAPQESDVEVSPELMARFNQALEELDERATDRVPQTKITVRDDMPRVDQLPVRMLTRLPSMAFNAHMYASRPSDRWVRVNGKQLGQGDWIEDEVQIVKIEAQRVILSFEGKEFSMAALTDW